MIIGLSKVEDLAVSTFSMDLDGKVPVAALQAGYRRTVGKLGKTVARLNVTTSPKTFTLHGSSQDAIGQKLSSRKSLVKRLGPKQRPKRMRSVLSVGKVSPTDIQLYAGTCTIENAFKINASPLVTTASQLVTWAVKPSSPSPSLKLP